MIRKTRLEPMCKVGVIAVVSLCLLVNRICAHAQTTPPGNTAVKGAETPQTTKPDVNAEAIAAKLDVPLNIALGTAKLPQVLEHLARKTGADITCEPYLAERDVIVQMQDVSARDVLNALCELHDWMWYRKEDGRYLVARKSLRLRQNAANIPLYVQAAIPTDLRHFLNAGTTLDAFADPPTYPTAIEETANRNLRLTIATQKIIAQLLASLDVSVLARQRLQWEQLSAQQREWLLTMYVLQSFRKTRADIIHDDSLKYVLDLNANTLYMQSKGVLAIESLVMVGNKASERRGIAVRVGELPLPVPKPVP